MSLIQIVLAAATLAAACGGGKETALEPQAAEHMEVAAAGHAATEAQHMLHWSGIELCDGSAAGKSIKNSIETELGNYEKSKTEVKFVGLNVGPSSEYSCAGLTIEGLVSMSDKSGAFFEGGDSVACMSETGRQLTAEVGLGHDTDLRWLEPSDAPTLNFDVELREMEASDAGISAELPAFFRCSFDLELR